MSELKKVNLDYLTEKEVVDFYELFFGKILIKKPDFSYHQTLSKSLVRDNLVQSVLERLNDQEENILKILSRAVFIPWPYLVDKLHCISGYQSTVISKALNSLIQKKYIFLREEKTLVVPDVYFPGIRGEIHAEFFNEPNQPISTKFSSDLNNLVNYFNSRELKFSQALMLYKKDLDEAFTVFRKFGSLSKEDLNVLSYFYSVYFLNEDRALNIEKVKDFYSRSPLGRILMFLNYTFPAFYAIVDWAYKKKRSVFFEKKYLKELWIHCVLQTENTFEPVKLSFEDMLKFINLTGLIHAKEKVIRIHYITDDHEKSKDQGKLSTNYNFYINADSNGKDYFFPSLFADFVKYNKIVEYDITEESVRKAIIKGVNYGDFNNYLKNNKIEIASNVDKTIKQWFDKHGSYFFATGTLFFCENDEKGGIIRTLIENGMVKALEVIRNRVFQIPDSSKAEFFQFLDKSGIHYYEKNPEKQLSGKQAISEHPLNLVKIIKVTEK